MNRRIRLAILGCSGSVGQQTLSVVQDHPDRFEIVALTNYSDIQSMRRLVKQHKPAFVGIVDENMGSMLKDDLPKDTELALGSECNSLACMRDDVDAVVIAVTGMAAVFPLIAAIRNNKHIALANKESMVCGGELIKAELDTYGGMIYPVDSEQSAIFQCIQGLSEDDEISKLILTASGGPFRNWSLEQMRTATVEQTLKHPNWVMGKKITIDCATMVNKGLEVIEAAFLFGVPHEKIEVLVHPQSVVHSFVETRDNAMLAQLAVPDMRLPIQYALTYPERIHSSAAKLDIAALSKLEFYKPDYVRFPGLALAYEAMKLGGTATATYNAANEVAVDLFLARRIEFLDISHCIEHALCGVSPVIPKQLGEILEADAKARTLVMERFG